MRSFQFPLKHWHHSHNYRKWLEQPKGHFHKEIPNWQQPFFFLLMYSLYGHFRNFKFKQKYQQNCPCFQTIFPILQCVKSVRIRSNPVPYFPAFVLNAKRYGVRTCRCSYFKSSHLQMFFKIGVLQNLAIFTEKHLCWNLLLIKL